MNDFQKPAYTSDEHLELLRGRGLVIEDEDTARFYLANISYYRLSAYMRPYYVPESVEHTFQPGTRFEDVLVLYTFDRELRLLLLDAIERIEVALRAQLTNALAEHHGPHGHRDPALFHQRYNHEWLCKRLTKAADGPETEAFLRHYRENYPAAHEEPPIWMAAEILTFKEISILFATLRQPADKQRLEAHFQWRYPVLWKDY